MVQEQRIPPNWAIVKLSDLFLDPVHDIVDGPFGSNLKASEYKPKGVPILRIQNINRFEFIDQNIQYVSAEKADFLSRHNYQPGDIIITKLGEPVGKTCIVPNNFPAGIIVADLVRVRVNPLYTNKQFLTYQLNSFRVIQQFEANTKGTTRQRVKLSVIRNLNLKIPPVNEQHRIVSKLEELFSELDHCVKNLKQAQKQLIVYRQSLLKSAFEGKLTERWRIENNPVPVEKLFENVKEERQTRYQQELKDWKEAVKLWEKEKKGKKPSKPKKIKILSELKEDEKPTQLPISWKWTRIGDFEQFIGSGSTPKGGRNVYVDTGIPFIRSMNVYPNKLHLDGLAYIEDTTHAQMKRSQLKEKDVLLNITGASIGRCAYVPEGFGEGNVNQHVCIIRPFTKVISNEYLCQYLNSPASQQIIQSLNSGATREAITLSQIRNFPFPLSSTDEQKVIVSELESKFSIIDNLDQTIEASLQKSETLKQSILRVALEGLLIEQDPDDEPASALLERIKEDKKKYSGERVRRKELTPRREKKMNKSLSEIIENNFKNEEFSYDDLKEKCNLSYEEIRSQLFQLIESNEKFKSRFDQSLQEIKYFLSE